MMQLTTFRISRPALSGWKSPTRALDRPFLHSNRRPYVLARPCRTRCPTKHTQATTAKGVSERADLVQGIEKEPTETRVLSGGWESGAGKMAVLLGSCLCLVLLCPLIASATTTATTPSTSFSLLGALKGTPKISHMSAMGGTFLGFMDFVLHLDVHLGSIIARHGTMTYALLFGIVFCETGLVLTPFLPGDSLLFAVGALSGLGKLNFSVVCAIFISAAILGDAVNYAVGAWLGQKAVNAGIISKSNVTKTEHFFEQYGGKTIVLARFVPIVRTFAPFVAGMSHMDYQRFAAFNIGGALLWTFLFCGMGFFFGNLPFVEKNFSLVVLAIVAISVVPIIYEIASAKRNHTRTHPQT